MLMNFVKKMPCSLSAKYFIFYTDSENDHAKLRLPLLFLILNLQITPLLWNYSTYHVHSPVKV